MDIKKVVMFLIALFFGVSPLQSIQAMVKQSTTGNAVEAMDSIQPEKSHELQLFNQNHLDSAQEVKKKKPFKLRPAHFIWGGVLGAVIAFQPWNPLAWKTVASTNILGISRMVIDQTNKLLQKNLTEEESRNASGQAYECYGQRSFLPAYPEDGNLNDLTEYYFGLEELAKACRIHGGYMNALTEASSLPEGELKTKILISLFEKYEAPRGPRDQIIKATLRFTDQNFSEHTANTRVARYNLELFKEKQEAYGEIIPSKIEDAESYYGFKIKLPTDEEYREKHRPESVITVEENPIDVLASSNKTDVEFERKKMKIPEAKEYKVRKMPQPNQIAQTITNEVADIPQYDASVAFQVPKVIDSASTNSEEINVSASILSEIEELLDSEF